MKPSSASAPRPAAAPSRGIIFDLSRDNVWPAPFTGRCLINDHARRWTGREVELLQNVKAVAAEYAAAKAAGNFDIAAVIAGEAVGLIHDIPPAAEIVDRIVAEADQILLGRRNSSTARLTGSLNPRTSERTDHVAGPPTARPLQDRISDRAGADGGRHGRRPRDRGGAGRRAGLAAVRDAFGGEGARAGQHRPPARLGAAQHEFLLSTRRSRPIPTQRGGLEAAAGALLQELGLDPGSADHRRQPRAVR